MSISRIVIQDLGHRMFLPWDSAGSTSVSRLYVALTCKIVVTCGKGPGVGDVALRRKCHWTLLWRPTMT